MNFPKAALSMCACNIANALNNPARGANALNSPARGVLLQALFRPITVVVPDRQLIMENMLMAEGFVEAKMLAKKFASLYYLLEDLLSPAKYVSVLAHC